MKKLVFLILVIFLAGLSGCAKMNQSSPETIVVAGKIYRNTKTGEVFDEYYNLQFRLDKVWCDEYVDEYYRSYSYGEQLDKNESCLRGLGYEHVTEQIILPAPTSPFISSTVIKRMRELNDMRAKHLITEEDYKKEKEEILSEK